MSTSPIREHPRSPGASKSRRSTYGPSATSDTSARTGSPESTSTESSGSDPSSSSNTTPPSEGNNTNGSHKSTAGQTVKSRNVSNYPYSQSSRDTSSTNPATHTTLPLYVRVPSDPTNLDATGREMERAQTRLGQVRRAARRAEHLAAMDRTMQAQRDLVSADSSDDNLLGRDRFHQILRDRRDGREAELLSVVEAASSVRRELANAMDDAVQHLKGSHSSDEYGLLDAVINHHSKQHEYSRQDSSGSLSSMKSEKTTRPPPPIATLQPPFQAFPHPIVGRNPPGDRD